MESESDVGGSDDDDYGKAFEMAEDDDDDVKEEETEPSDGEYVLPIRPIRKVRLHAKRRWGIRKRGCEGFMRQIR